MASGDDQRDTIAAIATPAGRGGVGIVRISGPAAPLIGRAVAGEVPAPRRATLAVFADERGERIDEGLVLYFPAPHSYTGEAVLELHAHGGPVVMQMLLGSCVAAGARLAEPGEFTKRAFLEGKLDLAQAEAVADLIDAASREAARSAQRSLSGEFSAAINAIVEQVTDLRALVEALIDFPEEDIDALHAGDAAKRLDDVQDALKDLLQRSRQGSLLSGGLRVVIAGAPNAGKSSLLNRLVGEERAIVTPIAGTTRDALRETIEIGGVPMTLVDTAGIRDSEDHIERLGVARTKQELEHADVVLAVIDAADSQAPMWSGFPVGRARIDVFNKCDLVPAFVLPVGHPHPAVLLSTKTGEGLPALRQAILAAIGWSSAGETVFLARERHLLALEQALAHLHAASTEHGRWELFAEELRLAQHALGSITGSVTADELLGRIFARFCIGK